MPSICTPAVPFQRPCEPLRSELLPGGKRSPMRPASVHSKETGQHAHARHPGHASSPVAGVDFHVSLFFASFMKSLGDHSDSRGPT